MDLGPQEPLTQCSNLLVSPEDPAPGLWLLPIPFWAASLGLFPQGFKLPNSAPWGEQSPVPRGESEGHPRTSFLLDLTQDTKQSRLHSVAV